MTRTTPHPAPPAVTAAVPAAVPAVAVAGAQRRLRLRVTGVVQGVGFRPFVRRLANQLGVSGFVGNDAAAVFIEAQGEPAALTAFTERLRHDAPPLARVATVTRQAVAALPAGAEAGFAIVASRGASGARTLIPPDVATCPACLAELFDPDDRRYRHPFITCTDCGPRFTIIRDLPYDRPATTMAGFAMCPDCAAEYRDPDNRRYHAQPVACPRCGPRLWFTDPPAGAGTPPRRVEGAPPRRVEGTDPALAAAQRVLAEGRILAVKGVGGYHLACRADDPAAVARLRRRKARGDKPFALLARDLAVAARLAWISAEEERLLTAAARPIVLLSRREGAPVAAGVAPGNPLLGVMLPYSPLHHLLLAPVPGDAAGEVCEAIVLTSANVSDEPLCYDDADALRRLPPLADAVLTHDRPIHLPCDDSVLRVVDGQPLPIRRSRGYAPLPVPLSAPLPATLGVGGELKNTFCLVSGDQAHCSAHVGDMGSVATLRAFEAAVAQLSGIVAQRPAVVAVDAHPGYLSREWGERHGARLEPPVAPVLVQHHHAHVVSLLAEHQLVGEPVLGVAFDGTGYGADGTVWGGEFLLLGRDSAEFTRVGHLRPVPLPGGDAAVANPCRMALAYLRDAGLDWEPDLAPVAACTPAERSVVAAQLRGAGGAAVPCTSAGRLFDAVAALLGVRQRVGYEAQAAIELEALAATAAGAGPLHPGRFAVTTDGVVDHRPVIGALVAGVRDGADPARLALGFHLALAEAVADVAEGLARGSGVRLVGLTGGVFQNAVLLGECRRRLAGRGLRVLIHSQLPPNDGGLAVGQAVVGALRAARAAVAAE